MRRGAASNCRCPLAEARPVLAKRGKEVVLEMATTCELTPSELEAYRSAARRRHQQEQQLLVMREKRAWELARRAATLLRERFNVSRVMVFGSLAHKACFTPWSDVDLAAWDLHPEDTFRAIGAVMDMDQEIGLNLVDVQACSPSLLASIEREGLEV
jgi:predicted nucleotidyltransferase